MKLVGWHGICSETDNAGCGGTCSSADLGWSSKMSNVNIEDWSREGFHANMIWTWVKRSWRMAECLCNIEYSLGLKGISAKTLKANCAYSEVTWYDSTWFVKRLCDDVCIADLRCSLETTHMARGIIGGKVLFRWRGRALFCLFVKKWGKISYDASVSITASGL